MAAGCDGLGAGDVEGGFVFVSLDQAGVGAGGEEDGIRGFGGKAGHDLKLGDVGRGDARLAGDGDAGAGSVVSGGGGGGDVVDSGEVAGEDVVGAVGGGGEGS